LEVEGRRIESCGGKKKPVLSHHHRRG